ncbi:MAG: MATE family efflux transporter, partial [Muribaculaceae bacterium]|nr:MATE family efflux transporter [Muribaculaceae bacterium]
MKRSSLNRQILALAIPAIIANITTPLLSLVDIAIVGRLGSPAYVGAVAVGGTLFSMLYWLFSFLRFGTSGLTAQSLGEGNDEKLRLTLLRSLMIAAIASLLLILLHRPLGGIALDFMDTDADTRRLAEIYFNLLIFGAPAVLAQYALTGWFVGRQDTRTPMWLSLIINVTNIGASLILVFGLGMKIEGVALGTLIAQWVGSIAGLIVAAKRISLRRINLRSVINLPELKRFFSVNFDIFLRTLCLIAVSVWFTRSGASQGPEILAVNSMLLQLFILFSYFMDGFAFAAEALCGKLVGAGEHLQLKKAISTLLRWGLSMALIFTVIYAAGGEAFLRLLTDDGGIIHASEPYRLWAAAIPLAGFMAFTADGIVIGLTRTRVMLGSMAIATAAYFILWFWLSPILGNHALWIAFLTYLLLRGVLILSFLKLGDR